MQIVIVNDGTQDHAMETVNNYWSIDRRISVYNQSNMGLSSARNLGLSIADGEYVFFLDSDDAIHPLAMETLVGLMQSERADIVSCSFEKCLEIPCSYEHFKLKYDTVDKITALENIYKPQASSACFTISCAKLYKRKLFEKIRFPLGKLHEDEFVIHLLIDMTCRVCYCHNKLYYYRQHQQSIMHNIDSLGCLNSLEAYYSQMQYFEKAAYACLKNMALKRLLNECVNNYYTLRKKKLLNNDTEYKIKQLFNICLQNNKKELTLFSYFLYKFFENKPNCYFLLIKIPYNLCQRFKTKIANIH